MRIIFNTSFIIHEGIEAEWIDFMKTQYIRPISEQNICQDIIFTKVSIDQPDGKTYSLQLIFDSEKRQDHFLETCLPAMEEKLISLYNGKYFCFSSTLTEVCIPTAETL